MKIEQKIKYRTLLLSLTIIILLSTPAFFYLNNFLDQQLAQQLDRREETLNTLLQRVLQQHNLQYESRLKNILDVYGVKESFKERDRTSLYHIVSPQLKQMQAENPYIKIMSFRLPDGSTFLRVHKPEMFGDPINPRRKIIVDTNTLRKVHYGFEVGKLKMTHRIVIPIFYKEEYLGLVEFGVEPAAFMEVIAEVVPMRYALVIRKSMQDVLMSQRRMIQKEKYALAEEDPFFIKLFKQMSFEKRYFANISGNTYSVNSQLLLKDHKGKKAAFIITAENITTEISDYNKLRILLMLSVIISILFLLFILNYSLNFYISTIRKQLYTDELTGLPNRDALLQKLKGKAKSVILLIDINGFRNINELYGISNGNVILKQFSVFIQTMATENSMMPFRISSDEFIMLKVSDELESEIYFSTFSNTIFEEVKEEKFYLHELNIPIELEVTIGVSYGFDTSLEKADMALKKAQESQQPYLFYSSDIDSKKDTHKVISIKKDLRYALEQENIVAYYQPIVNDAGEVIKYETLVRMIKMIEGKKEVISPYFFLELSQKFNLYPAISKTIISQGFKKAEKIEQSISINLTPSDMMDKLMQSFIFEKLGRCRHPEKIIFEITENENISDYSFIINFVEKVHDYGAKIAIDDFGSGYSNYSHVFILKPDYLKIDGSLIKNLTDNKESQIFVKTIVMLAQQLGVKTIAEYVHSEEVYNIAKSYGVDEFQGYYFGEPKSTTEPI